MRTKHLPIAQPCHEDWEGMDRVERGRFCQVCVKQVFDLSTMTEHEARGLLRDNEGSRICVRYQHDDHGQIRFHVPAPVPPLVPATAAANTCSAAPRRLAWAGAAIMAVAMAACTPHEREREPQRTLTELETIETVQMGSMEVPLVEPEHHVKGEIQAIEPPPLEPEPLREVLGDMAVEPMPVHERKGDMIARPEPEPCDR